MRYLKISLLLSILICGGMGRAYSENTNNETIVNHILSTSNNQITISQPSALSDRLKPIQAIDASERTSGNVEHQGGYRIQVFSDNNQRTAKNEASIKERNISSKFPTLSTYLTYKAPAWRLRVGDFRNYEEAQEIMNQIKKAFPGYSREIIIVRDRINITQ